MIDRSFVRLGERLVHIRSAGDKGHPPLFMMHASPASSHSLQGLMQGLANHYYVIAPDTPGNGQSDPLEIPNPSMADYAQAMQALVEAMALKDFSVYGTHTGAHIAMEWAKILPGSFEAMVLDGVALLDADMRQEFLERYAPPQTPQPDGGQFYWAWQFMRDQMIFFPHYKKDLDHLRPGGTFDARVLHGLTMDVLNALETYHLPYEAVFRQDVLASAAQVATRALVLTSDDGPIESGMEPLISALQNASTAQTSGSDADKAAAVIDFLSEQQG